MASREVTDEATAEGLRLSAEAGAAYEKMVRYFISNVATSGAMERHGDFIVGVAIEEAEPLWHLCAGKLELKDPPGEANAHLEVVVMDAADKRFIPALGVTATVLDADGDEIGTWDLPLLWHPTMFHYGRNVAVARGGKVSMIVSVETPAFPRHDEVNGQRYAEPVRARFDGLSLQTGRK